MNQRFLALLTFILAVTSLSRAQTSRRRLEGQPGGGPAWEVLFDHDAATGAAGAIVRRTTSGSWLAEIAAASGAVGIAVRLPHEDLSTCSGILIVVRADSEMRVRPFSQSSGWVFRDSGDDDLVIRAGEETSVFIARESMADPAMVESVGIQFRRRSSSRPARVELLSATPVIRAAAPRVERPAVGPVSAPGSVPRYSVYTAAFGLGKGYDNPYDPDVIDVRAEFRLPSGATRTLPAFWFQDYAVAPGSEKYEQYVPAGDPVWKVRFLTTETGAHSWRILVRDKDGLIEEAGPFEFTVEASAEHGPVKRHPTNPLHLQHANGTTYQPRGYNLAFEDGNPDLNGTAYYRLLLDSFGSAGQNWTRLWLTDFARTALEWGSSHFSGFYSGVGKYSQRAAWRVDKFMDFARENGVQVQLVLNDHGQFSSYVNARWSDGNPYSAAQGGPVPSDRPDQFFSDGTARSFFQRRLRYAIARWSAYPNLLAWELWNEVQYAGTSTRNFSSDSTTRAAIAEWHRVMSEYLKAQDPFGHLVTTSSDDPGASGWASIWNLASIDMVQSHHYVQPPSIRDSRIRDYVTAAHQAYGKPVLVAEMGLKGSSEPECNFDPQTFLSNTGVPASERTTANRSHVAAGTVLRNGIWSGAATQSAGLNWWWGCYIAADARRNRTAPDFPLNDRLFPALAAFWGGEDLAAEPLRTPAVPVQGSIAAYGVLGRSSALLWVRDTRETYGSGRPPAVEEGRQTQGAAVSVTGLDAGDYVVSLHRTTGNGDLVTEFEQRVAGSSTAVPLPAFTGDTAVKVHDGTRRTWGLVPRSTRAWELNGSPETTRAGYGVLRPVAGPAGQSGAAVLTLTSGGSVVTELTVPALPTSRTLWTVAEISAPSEVGLALANPGATAAVLTLQLFSADGTPGASRELTLTPGQHTARFLAELFPAVGAPFRGTLRVTSDVPVGMLTLRGTKNSVGDFVLTTLPGRLDSTPQSVGSLVLPQVADGGGYQTEWLLVNSSEAPLLGRLSFRSQNGSPWEIAIGGTRRSEIAYSVPARGLLRLVSDGNDPLRAGYCVLTPTGGSAAPAAAAVVRFSRDGLRSESGVPFVESARSGSVFWESGQDIFTGIAFANTTERAQKVRLVLYHRDGGERRFEASLDLPAQGQAAKLITELFPGLPPTGRGVMSFECDEGVGYLALRVRNTPRGDTLTSSMMFGDLPPGEDRLLPQIVDGGGYSTRVVVVNSGGVASGGTVQFRGEAGEPRKVLLREP